MPRVFASTLLAALLAAFPALAQHHDHASPEPSVVDAVPAQRFATDAPLRRNMQEITRIVDALDHYEHGHMPAADATKLATRIDGHVRDIIANCKLPADADAALHRIIVPLLQQARALAADPADPSAVTSMQATLADYERLFEVPSSAPPAR